MLSYSSINDRFSNSLKTLFLSNSLTYENIENLVELFDESFKEGDEISENILVDFLKIYCKDYPHLINDFQDVFGISDKKRFENIVKKFNKATQNN